MRVEQAGRNSGELLKNYVETPVVLNPAVKQQLHAIDQDPLLRRFENVLVFGLMRSHGTYEEVVEVMVPERVMVIPRELQWGLVNDPVAIFEKAERLQVSLETVAEMSSLVVRGYAGDEGVGVVKMEVLGNEETVKWRGHDVWLRHLLELGVEEPLSSLTEVQKRLAEAGFEGSLFHEEGVELPNTYDLVADEASVRMTHSYVERVKKWMDDAVKAEPEMYGGFSSHHHPLQVLKDYAGEEAMHNREMVERLITVSASDILFSRYFEGPLRYLEVRSFLGEVGREHNVGEVVRGVFDLEKFKNDYRAIEEAVRAAWNYAGEDGKELYFLVSEVVRQWEQRVDRTFLWRMILDVATEKRGGVRSYGVRVWDELVHDDAFNLSFRRNELAFQGVKDIALSWLVEAEGPSLGDEKVLEAHRAHKTWRLVPALWQLYSLHVVRGDELKERFVEALEVDEPEEMMRLVREKEGEKLKRNVEQVMQVVSGPELLEEAYTIFEKWDLSLEEVLEGVEIDFQEALQRYRDYWEIEE